MQYLSKILRSVPAALASKSHVLFLFVLGVFLVALPLLHLFTPSATAELIGGNYTNVTSAIGGCIAAGLSAHVAKTQQGHDWDLSNLTRSLMHLHHKHDTLASQMGTTQPIGVVPPATTPPAPITTEVTTTVTEA